MKTSVFIVNIVSAILFLTIIFSNEPSITGFAVAESTQKINLNLSPSNPLSFAILFIIVTIGVDIYFYLKSRKNIQE